MVLYYWLCIILYPIKCPMKIHYVPLNIPSKWLKTRIMVIKISNSIPLIPQISGWQIPTHPIQITQIEYIDF